MPFSKGVGELRSGWAAKKSLSRSLVTAIARFKTEFSQVNSFGVRSGSVRCGRVRSGVCAGLVFLTAASTFTTDIKSAQAGWSNVGSHPGASAQPTAQGRALTDLELIDRRIYAGYGDYDANTGPIPVYSYNVRRKRYKYEKLTMQTEAIYKFRDLPSGLWALGTDPRGQARHHFSRRDRKWTSSNGLDRVGGSDRAEHVYDMVQWRGALWAAGGTAGNKGGIWRSADNGKTWQTAKTFSPVSGIANDFTRVYWMGVLNDELYVQPVDGCHIAFCSHPTSYIFNGERWRNGPDILGNFGVGAPADNFANALVLRTNDTSTRPGIFQVVKGGVVSNPLGVTPVRDYTVAENGYLYALIAQSNPYDPFNDQIVIRTRNLIHWECLFKAPRKAISIEVYAPADEESAVYVGMTNSRIKKRVGSDTAPCPIRQPRLFRSSLIVAPGTSLYNIDFN